MPFLRARRSLSSALSHGRLHSCLACSLQSLQRNPRFHRLSMRSGAILRTVNEKGFGGRMRRLIEIIAVILCFSFAGLGQGTSQTIQVGYAVITPAVPGTTGLVASETLIQTRGQDVFQVGVFPPNLATNVLLPVQISTSLARTLGIAIANPNNIAANITLTLRRADGTQFTATTLSVLARQQIAKLLTEIFLPPPPGGFTTQVPIPAEFTGTLVITSSSPVSILGLNFRGPNYSTT